MTKPKMKMNAISALDAAADLAISVIPSAPVYTFVALIAIIMQKIPTTIPVLTRSWGRRPHLSVKVAPITAPPKETTFWQPMRGELGVSIGQSREFEEFGRECWTAPETASFRTKQMEENPPW